MKHSLKALYLIILLLASPPAFAGMYDPVNYVNYNISGLNFYSGSEIYNNGAAPGYTQNQNNRKIMNLDLSYGKFMGAYTNESGAIFTYQYLINADFSNAKLQGSNFYGATLSNATFTDAEVSYVNFSNASFSYEMLVQTKSYADKDLRGLQMTASAAGGDFSGQNLQGAKLNGISATTDFSNADLRGVSFTPSAGIYTNTITPTGVLMIKVDGTIYRGVHLRNNSQYLRIRKSESEQAVVLNASTTAKGGSQIIIEVGGELQLKSLNTTEVTFTLQDTTLIFNVDVKDNTLEAGKIHLTKDGNFASGKLAIQNTASIKLILDDNFLISEELDLMLINNKEGTITGNFEKEQVSILYADGSSYEGIWSVITSSDDISGIGIRFEIPEPNAYAAIFGLISLAFGIYRKRK